MSWDSEFAEPIDLPNNVAATTLRQVIAYISELPDAEQNSPEWQNARERILQAADQVGSIWFAPSQSCRHFNGTEKTRSDGVVGCLVSGDEVGVRKS
jgi:hypothetical protein